MSEALTRKGSGRAQFLFIFILFFLKKSLSHWLCIVPDDLSEIPKG